MNYSYINYPLKGRQPFMDWRQPMKGGRKKSATKIGATKEMAETQEKKKKTHKHHKNIFLIIIDFFRHFYLTR